MFLAEQKKQKKSNDGKEKEKESKKKHRVCVIELGGTVGDIESMPFIEAMRQFQFEVGKSNFFAIHVSLVPNMGEQKTKPTQQCVRELRSLGINPDIIACRSTQPLKDSVRNKIAAFCNVDDNHVVSVHDVKNLYHVPLLLVKEKIHEYMCEKFKFEKVILPNLTKWNELVEIVDKINESKKQAIHIALIGKYTGLKDSYHSIIKALNHSCTKIFNDRKLQIDFIDSQHLEKDEGKESEKAWELLKKAHGIIVPGGYGIRGIEGMIKSIQYARENKIPLLGVCLGMQITIIEFARNVLKYEDANSEEFDKSTKNPVVVFMPDFTKDQKLGGTMRLGLKKSYFKKDKLKEVSKVYKLYGEKEVIEERHRHRYEVNTKYVEECEKNGLIFIGQNEAGDRQEIIELKGHPYLVGAQFHPEFLSRPLKPSPIFVGLFEAIKEKYKFYY